MDKVLEEIKKEFRKEYSEKFFVLDNMRGPVDMHGGIVFLAQTINITEMSIEEIVRQVVTKLTLNKADAVSFYEIQQIKIGDNNKGMKLRFGVAVIKGP